MDLACVAEGVTRGLLDGTCTSIMPRRATGLGGDASCILEGWGEVVDLAFVAEGVTRGLLVWAVRKGEISIVQIMYCGVSTQSNDIGPNTT